MTDTRGAWEVRARSFGPSYHGVLFKGFTEQANDIVHAWHARLVREIFVPEVKLDGLVIDLGCGYGRLPRVLAESRADLLLIGQDISHCYCSNVRTNMGQAVQGDLAVLPFCAGTLSAAIAVTSLMYVDRAQIKSTLKGIRKTLIQGAPFLVVDPGEELRAWIERIAGRCVASSTRGSGFCRGEYRRLVYDAGFKIIRQGGNPRDSLVLLSTMGGVWAGDGSVD